MAISMFDCTMEIMFLCLIAHQVVVHVSISSILTLLQIIVKFSILLLVARTVRVVAVWSQSRKVLFQLMCQQPLQHSRWWLVKLSLVWIPILVWAVTLYVLPILCYLCVQIRLWWCHHFLRHVLACLIFTFIVQLIHFCLKVACLVERHSLTVICRLHLVVFVEVCMFESVVMVQLVVFLSIR